MVANWIGLVLGIWILISPWPLGFGGITIMMWNNVIAGLVLVLVNLWAIFGEEGREDSEKVESRK